MFGNIINKKEVNNYKSGIENLSSLTTYTIAFHSLITLLLQRKPNLQFIQRSRILKINFQMQT
jgi:hypothetical protein